MSKKDFKVLVAVAVTFIVFFCAGLAYSHPPYPRYKPRAHLVRQVQHGTERFLYVHNDLARPIWAYFECTNHLTTIPIGIPGGRMAEVRLADIAPDEQCLLNHYRIQLPGQSPDTWIPASDYQFEVRQ
jgi:hypothetical protein